MAFPKTKLVIGATAAVVATVTLVGVNQWSKVQAFFQDSPKELIDEVWHIIDKDYVDGTFNQTDWRKVRLAYLNQNYSSKDDAYEAIRKMLEPLGDAYTRFMDPDEFKNMKIDTSGELTGVGIQLSQDEKTKELVVVAPIEDTPAFTAGVQSRDVIIKINGKSTEGMNVDDAVKLIRGPVGETVTLTVRRDEKKELEFAIRRDRIEIHPVRYSERNDEGFKTGYIRLNQFNANAAEEMRTAIRTLETKNVDGYVLDLRSNPGGLLFASIEIARMWLNDGTIVSTVDRRGISDREEANGRALTDRPLVVLVDGGSASASEILSGALQDNHRAELIGTKTFGKGLVQSVRPLGDGSGLAVTIAKYLTPSGRDINKHGIDPDVVLELSETAQETLSQDRTLIGTLQDPQYAKAITVLKDKIAAKKAQK